MKIIILIIIILLAGCSNQIDCEESYNLIHDCEMECVFGEFNDYHTEPEVWNRTSHRDWCIMMYCKSHNQIAYKELMSCLE